MWNRDTLRRFTLPCLFLATCLTFALACGNLLRWMRQTDMMFGHYKGPPELVLNAFFWSAWTTGLAVIGTLIYLAQRFIWRSTNESRQKPLQGILSLAGLGLWIGSAVFGILLWSIARSEVPHAKLQVQRDSFANIGPDSSDDQVSRTIEALDSPDWLTRQQAAEAMARLDRRRILQAADALRRAVKSEDPLVAANAATALGSLGDQVGSNLDTLMEALGSQNDIITRVAAARALAAIGEPAHSAIVQHLASDSPEARSRGLFALRFFTEVPKTILEHLRPLLRNDDAAIRQEVAPLWRKLSSEYHSTDSLNALLIELRQNPARPDPIVIGRLQSVGYRAYEATPLLEPLLESPDRKTRLAAATAIWHITGRSAPILDLTDELLHGDEDDQLAATRALSSLGPLAEKQLPDLEPLLQHPDATVSSFAASSVQRIKRESRRSLEEVNDLLAQDAGGFLERGLYEVERRGDLVPQLVPDVRRLLHHDSVNIRLRALRALVRMGPASTAAIDEIKVLAEGPREDAREVASVVLRAINFLYVDRPDRQ